MLGFDEQRVNLAYEHFWSEHWSLGGTLGYFTASSKEYLLIPEVLLRHRSPIGPLTFGQRLSLERTFPSPTGAKPDQCPPARRPGKAPAHRHRSWPAPPPELPGRYPRPPPQVRHRPRGARLSSSPACAAKWASAWPACSISRPGLPTRPITWSPCPSTTSMGVHLTAGGTAQCRNPGAGPRFALHLPRARLPKPAGSYPRSTRTSVTEPNVQLNQCVGSDAIGYEKRAN